jgi:small subunit ribosomal protein S20
VAHSLSAKKRIRQNEKRNIINRARKSMIKTQIKHFEMVLESGDASAATVQLRSLSRRLDKISGTSTMHKNTAARIKSRMTKRLNALAAK